MVVVVVMTMMVMIPAESSNKSSPSLHSTRKFVDVKPSIPSPFTPFQIPNRGPAGSNPKYLWRSDSELSSYRTDNARSLPVTGRSISLK